MFANIHSVDAEGFEMFRQLLHKKLSKRQIALSLLFLFFSILFINSTSGFAKSGQSGEKRYKYYTSISVEKGNTLWNIASEYITEEYDSIEEYILEVKQLNHLTGDGIYAGEFLVIPYYSAAEP